ncbi:cytochrome P450 [Streptomyces sp. AC536]|uniref:cytochrome P450 n=1 Tax=Streptomyces buecherae TaxID=2763006 RepID=UPI00164E44A8|nr:cytochrome P450 [Streptomyces buecherae]MBC3984662.1 cytochrome P450 [Streptomyces buecherae]QNJ38480.1 cytochrome P450 [Streptomyces buecherae]
MTTAQGPLTFPFHDWSQALSPHHQRLREADAPVCPVVSEYTGDRLWLVTRYATAKRLLEDPRFSSTAAMAPGAPRQEPVELRAPGTTGDGVSVLREAGMHSVFTEGLGARAARRHEAWLCDRAETLLGDLAERRGPVDLAAGFAEPLAAAMTSRVLLGELSAEEVALLRERTDLALQFCGATAAEQRAGLIDIHRFFTAHARRLAEGPGDHLLKRLAQASAEAGPLDDAALSEIAALLLIAGFPTSSGFLCGAVITLLRHPETLARLHGDPALVPETVEELLRYTPLSTGAAKRMATQDADIDGVPIRAGEVAMVSLEAANHDPNAFEDPDSFLPERQGPGHLGFGHGPNFCPGNRLARSLITAMVLAMARRPGLRLTVEPEEIRWHEGLFFRRPKAIPASW